MVVAGCWVGVRCDPREATVSHDISLLSAGDVVEAVEAEAEGLGAGGAGAGAAGIDGVAVRAAAGWFALMRALWRRSGRSVVMEG